MTFAGWGMILLFVALTVALAKPMGLWVYRLYAGENMPLSRVLGPVERGFYRVAGIDPTRDQSWIGYATALLAFNIAGIIFLFALLKLQGFLPLNPQGFPAVENLLALNTAVSFVTNTNWQNYGGESTLSHLSQMLGLTVQNFLSAATGLAVAFALIRGFARRALREVSFADSRLAKMVDQRMPVGKIQPLYSIPSEVCEEIRSLLAKVMTEQGRALEDLIDIFANDL